MPCSPPIDPTMGNPLGRNDTYGYALTAQPDQSQGRPTTNTGSQPTVQERPAHTCSPKAPVPDGRTVCPTTAAEPAEQLAGLRLISYRVQTPSSQPTPGSAERSTPAATSPPSRPPSNA